VVLQGTVHLKVTRDGVDIFLKSFPVPRDKRTVLEKSFFSSALKMQAGDELMVLLSGKTGGGGYTLTLADLAVLVRYV
jgi:hypothetical protein